MKRLIKSLLITSTFILLACSDDSLGKYVYYDLDQTLHTQGKCKAVLNYHGSMPVRVMAVESLRHVNFSKICSQCVTERQIIQLDEINRSYAPDDDYNSNDSE